MSPELCRGMCLDVRSDVYSLGVVLYALLTGRVPFNHKFFKSAVVRMQVEDTPIAPYVRKPEIPRKLSDVVMKSLKKDPDDRYNNCMAFAEAVANAA
jgi:serine/threonine-protein kinase